MAKKDAAKATLPASLAELRNKLVVVGAEVKSLGGGKMGPGSGVGILFDGNERIDDSTFTEQVMDHFSDCEESDFQDLRDGKNLRAEWIPFVMWQPDGLDNLEDVVAQQTKKASTRTRPYNDSFGSDYPQFQAMWFLHSDGRIATIDIDGTFVPAEKAEALVKDYRSLNLRLATPADLEAADDENDDEDE